MAVADAKSFLLCAARDELHSVLRISSRLSVHSSAESFVHELGVPSHKEQGENVKSSQYVAALQIVRNALE